MQSDWDGYLRQQRLAAQEMRALCDQLTYEAETPAQVAGILTSMIMLTEDWRDQLKVHAGVGS